MFTDLGNDNASSSEKMKEEWERNRGSLRVEKSVINDHGCIHGEGPEQERNI